VRPTFLLHARNKNALTLQKEPFEKEQEAEGSRTIGQGRNVFYASCLLTYDVSTFRNNFVPYIYGFIEGCCLLRFQKLYCITVLLSKVIS
jgi:hypothetical protein